MFLSLVVEGCYQACQASELPCREASLVLGARLDWPVLGTSGAQRWVFCPHIPGSNLRLCTGEKPSGLGGARLKRKHCQEKESSAL
jgi:hypothetical protein